MGIETDSTPIQVIDISSLEPRDLEPLWQGEARLWLEKLYWDVTPITGLIRRAVERGSLAGKAVRIGGDVAGYGYYVLEGCRAVVASVAFSPSAETFTIGSRLIGSLLASLRNDPSVHRIESQFVSFGLPWLPTFFHSLGFSIYRRAFLRRTLELLPSAAPHDHDLSYESCTPACLAEASHLMQEAHQDRVDAEMNELYRTREGCRMLLDNILHRRGCGEPIGSSSFLVRHRTGGASGLVIATEISPRHAHLAQVAVSPAMQGRGLGRLLLHRVLSALACEGFQSVSLMVSQANRKAYSLYTSVGFQEVLDFPVFSWDSVPPSTRSS